MLMYMQSLHYRHTYLFRIWVMRTYDEHLMGFEPLFCILWLNINPFTLNFPSIIFNNRRWPLEFDDPKSLLSKHDLFSRRNSWNMIILLSEICGLDRCRHIVALKCPKTSSGTFILFGDSKGNSTNVSYTLNWIINHICMQASLFAYLWQIY